MLSVVAPVSYNIGSANDGFVPNAAPVNVVTADFNGDGKLDLVVSHTADDCVYVLTGKGDGTFQAAVKYVVGESIQGNLRVADFNNDGKLDLFMPSGDVNNCHPIIMLGNGDGTFRSEITSSSFVVAGTYARGWTVADFNNDGKLDVASTLPGNGDVGGYITLLGNGDGTFQSGLSVVGNGIHYSRWITSADFNGDGKADLAIADGMGTSDQIGTVELSILLGNGNGTFGSPTHYVSPQPPPDDNPTATANPEDVIATDVNSDGKIDLIINDYDNVINVFLGNGNGTFQSAISAEPGHYPRGVVPADMNGDGKIDLVVTNVGINTGGAELATEGLEAGSVAILIGNGNGTFQAPITYQPFAYPGWTAIGDFNGDGTPDLATTRVYDGRTVNIMLNLSASTNLPPTVVNDPSAAQNPVTGASVGLSVLADDDAGEANVTYTWSTLPGAPANVAYSANGTNAAKNTTATFTKSGTYNFQVKMTDAAGLSAIEILTVVVTPTLTTIAVAPTGASVTATGTKQYTATGKDQFGNAISATYAWSVSGGGSISSNGLFTAGPSEGGPFIVTASSGGVSGTASVTINGNAPTVATAATASPNPAIGTTALLSVLGADDGGEANLTYTWALAGSPPASVAYSANGTNAAKNSTATFTKSGTYNFQVTITDLGGLSTTSSVSVTVNQTLTSIAVSPSSASVPTNITKQFIATGFDQFGAALAAQPSFVWSVNGGGTINNNGLLTAGGSAGGPFTVTAANGGISGTASATIIINQAPAVAAPAASAANPVVGTSVPLSALGADDQGEPNLVYTWATTGTPPATVLYSVNGTNASKNTVATFTKAGTYNFQVTITDSGNLTTTSSVTVVVNATLTSIAVAPANASITANGTLQYSASALDQFGTALVAQPTFAWSVSGGGSINSSGLFTAGTTAGGPYNVTASNSGINGTASITVNAPGTSTWTGGGTTNNWSDAANWDSGATPGANTTVIFNGTSAKNTIVDSAFAGTVAAVQLNAGYNGTLSLGRSLTITGNFSEAAGNFIAGTNGLLIGGDFTKSGGTFDAGTGTVTLNGTVNQNISAVGVSFYNFVLATASGHSMNVTGTLTTLGTFTWLRTAGFIVGAGGLGNGAIDIKGDLDDQNHGNTGNPYFTFDGTGDQIIKDTSGVNNVNGYPGGNSRGITINKPSGNLILQCDPVVFNGLSLLSGTVNTGNYFWIVGNAPLSTAAGLNLGNVMLSVNVASGMVSSGLQVTNLVLNGHTLAAPAVLYVSGNMNASGTGSGFTNGNGVVYFDGTSGTQTLDAGSSPFYNINHSGAGTLQLVNNNLNVNGALLNPGGTLDTNGKSIIYAVAPPTVTAASVNGSVAGPLSSIRLTFNTSVDTTTFTLADLVSFVGPSGGSISLTSITAVAGSNNMQFDLAFAPQYAAGSYALVIGPDIRNVPGTWMDQNQNSVPGQTTADRYTLTFNVTNQSPTVATAAAAGSSPVSGTTTNLSVLGADDAGESNLTYNWATTGTPPATVSFGTNNSNSAKNIVATFTKAGTYNFQVTITDAGGLSVVSSVSVTVNQTLATINVTPSTASVIEGAAQAFAAQGLDQFGNLLASQPTFNWSTTGLGSINAATGLYLAPAIGTGSAVVTATSGGKNGSVAVVITAGTDLLRSIVGADYGDGISTPNGQDLPSARAISNLLGTQTDDVLDPRSLSAFIYAWGQFIDHDLDLTPSGGASDPIAVPAGDPQFDPSGTGTQTLPFTRSATNPTTGTSATNPLNQVSVVTSSLDGSQVYGSDQTRANALRSFTGGLLNTSNYNLLPFNTAGFPNANDAQILPDNQLMLAGDVRANENIELTAIQVLFVREHNRQAGILAAQHPTWTDEQLYQGAKQIVIAEIQSITYNQYLPALLGSGSLTAYAGYNSSTNPGISAEFSEAAFRFGHSQLDDDVQFLNNDGTNFAFSFTLPGGIVIPVNTAADIASGNTGLPLLYAFFNPAILEQPGVVGAVLKYLATDNSQAVDPQMVDAVRNILFGAPGSGAGGQDLYALDIQRGRDVGLPTYNETRVAYGMSAVTGFSQITSDPTLQAKLQQIYGTVDKVELFVGGLAEDHAPNSSIGATFQAIIANQFERVRDADASWYQRTFSGTQLQQLQTMTLADIISANTTAGNLQSNVFFYFNGTAVASANPVIGTTTNLSVQLGDGVGDTDVSYTWSLIGTPPASVSFSVNGTHAARNTVATFTQAGTYNFQVTETNGAGLSASSTVSVTVNQTLTSINAAPSSSSLGVNATRQFSATAFDQFGHALSSQPTFTWSLVSGVGGITNAGLYTASANPGSATVCVINGSVSGTAFITVTNTAPILTAIAPTLASINEDQTSNGGQTIASIVASSLSDADVSALRGVAILAQSVGNGTWQYSLNGGAFWTNFGSVSVGQSLLLRSTDLVRFVPNAIAGTTATFTYRAWDQTAGSAGLYADSTTSGGVTAFSTATDTASIVVASVNDAPVHSVPGSQNVNSGAVLTLSTANGNKISIADVDVGLGTLQVTLTAVGGKLTLATVAGLTFSGGSGTADVTMTFTGTLAAINAALDGLKYAPNAGFSATGSVRIQTNDQGNSGGATQSDDDTIAVNINAAPTIIGVYAKGSSWSNSFLTYLGNNNLGDATLGYRVSNGASQLQTLPWINVNSVSIRFSEDVTIGRSDLTLIAASNGPTLPNISAFSYNASTHAATWTFDAFLPRDKYLLHLGSTVVDKNGGAMLDGEWTVSNSTISGNGSGGGDFNFRFNVLPADIDGNNVVGNPEILQARTDAGKGTLSTGYNLRKDLDGNGTISNAEILAARSRASTSITGLNEPIVPNGGPQESASAGPQPLVSDDGQLVYPFPALTQEQLAPIVAEAIARWKSSGLVAPGTVDWSALRFEITDLGPAYLGLYAPMGIIQIDDDGNGWGWFLDSTPTSDEEFTPTTMPQEENAASGNPAEGHVDLLTVVMHEIGRYLGYGVDTVAAGQLTIMAEQLATGVRRTFAPPPPLPSAVAPPSETIVASAPTSNDPLPLDIATVAVAQVESSSINLIPPVVPPVVAEPVELSSPVVQQVSPVTDPPSPIVAVSAMSSIVDPPVVDSILFESSPLTIAPLSEMIVASAPVSSVTLPLDMTTMAVAQVELPSVVPSGVAESIDFSLPAVQQISSITEPPSAPVVVESIALAIDDQPPADPISLVPTLAVASDEVAPVVAVPSDVTPQIVIVSISTMTERAPVGPPTSPVITAVSDTVTEEESLPTSLESATDVPPPVVSNAIDSPSASPIIPIAPITAVNEPIVTLVSVVAAIVPLSFESELTTLVSTNDTSESASEPSDALPPVTAVPAVEFIAALTNSPTVDSPTSTPRLPLPAPSSVYEAPIGPMRVTTEQGMVRDDRSEVATSSAPASFALAAVTETARVTDSPRGQPSISLNLVGKLKALRADDLPAVDQAVVENNGAEEIS